ncbi:MAG: hypothetical protein U9Q12_04160, partial [Patescibacteria group bacterium]|nr:hypothetical protein [Patescibacteria group bacterium]
QAQDLSLQTNKNIQTLLQLQTSIDENLTSIQADLTDLYKQNDVLSLQVEANTLASEVMIDIESKVDVLQTDVSAINELQDTLTSMMIALDADKLVYTDDEGNLTLSGVVVADKVIADSVETNTFAISDDIVDEDDGKEVNASSIGTAIIPAGETEFVVNTQAVVKGSRVFVTPKKALNQALAAEDVEWGESFVVKLLELHDTDIEFDWFIVGSK